LTVIIPVLVNVAFITLLERKILGLSQLRKGPNKVRFLGILQPFRDAIKLFSKELISPTVANATQFIVGPVLGLGLVLIVFLVLPFHESYVNISAGFIFVYIILRLNVFPVVISGWSSNRKYALIGRARAIAQTISYEVSLALIILFVLFLTLSLRAREVMDVNRWWVKILIFTPLAGIVLVSALAETNRTPFDFAEGESELVSGFNVEYGRAGFALIFIAEYARILFLSVVLRLIFFSARMGLRGIYLHTGAVVFIWVWVRTTFPRYRYDKLIGLTWKIFLPVSLLLLAFPLFLTAA